MDLENDDVKKKGSMAVAAVAVAAFLCIPCCCSNCNFNSDGNEQARSSNVEVEGEPLEVNLEQVASLYKAHVEAGHETLDNFEQKLNKEVVYTGPEPVKVTMDKSGSVIGYVDKDGEPGFAGIDNVSPTEPPPSDDAEQQEASDEPQEASNEQDASDDAPTAEQQVDAGAQPESDETRRAALKEEASDDKVAENVDSPDKRLFSLDVDPEDERIVAHDAHERHYALRTPGLFEFFLISRMLSYQRYHYPGGRWSPSKSAKWHKSGYYRKLKNRSVRSSSTGRKRSGSSSGGFGFGK